MAVWRATAIILVLLAGGGAGCEYDLRPKWLRDPDGNKWENPKPYVGEERDVRAEPRPDLRASFT